MTTPGSTIPPTDTNQLGPEEEAGDTWTQHYITLQPVKHTTSTTFGLRDSVSGCRIPDKDSLLCGVIDGVQLGPVFEIRSGSGYLHAESAHQIRHAVNRDRGWSA